MTIAMGIKEAAVPAYVKFLSLDLCDVIDTFVASCFFYSLLCMTGGI